MSDINVNIKRRVLEYLDKVIIETGLDTDLSVKEVMSGFKKDIKAYDKVVFYAQKIGKEIYITSRRQIVHGEYYLRMNKIYRYDESMGKVNSNPIIGTTDFYFGYENIGKDEEGKTIANQIGGGNGVLVNAPMISGVPRALRDAFERGEHIYEVEVEYFEDNETIKSVTPINQ